MNLAMIESSVVFIDSGIGGLPYLDWLRERRPSLPLYYLADTVHFPYGNLSAGVVRKAAVGAVRTLQGLGTPRLIVIACNTASVLALDDIREAAGCPVVGTVPALKSAFAWRGPIGVLATAGTVQSPYLDDLVSAFAPGRKIVKVAAGDIVNYVEESWFAEEKDGALSVLEPAIERLKESRVGSVVIGCTHFLYVMGLIKMLMGAGIPIVDSLDGVGRRVLSLLDMGNSRLRSKGRGSSGNLGFRGGSANAQDGLNSANSQDAYRGGFIVSREGIRDERYRRFAQVRGLVWLGEISRG